MRTAPEQELSTARRVSFSGLAVLFALVFGLGFFGWVFLVIGWFASAVFATYPGSTGPYAGSEGSLWGALAIAWGVVFIALAERRARAAS